MVIICVLFLVNLEAACGTIKGGGTFSGKSCFKKPKTLELANMFSWTAAVADCQKDAPSGSTARLAIFKSQAEFNSLKYATTPIGVPLWLGAKV